MFCKNGNLRYLLDSSHRFQKTKLVGTFYFQFEIATIKESNNAATFIPEFTIDLNICSD